MRKSQKSPARQVALPFRRFQLSHPIHSFRLTWSLVEGPNRTDGLEKILPARKRAWARLYGQHRFWASPYSYIFASAGLAQETGVQIDHLAAFTMELATAPCEVKTEERQEPVKLCKICLALLERADADFEDNLRSLPQRLLTTGDHIRLEPLHIHLDDHGPSAHRRTRRYRARSSLPARSGRTCYRRDACPK